MMVPIGVFCIFLYTSEQSDEDSPFLLKMQEKEGKENSFKVSKTRRKRKPGRKALWSADALNDMVDIITSDVCYRKKLIFTNTKNRNNGMVYSEILKKMKERANKRGDQITFSIQQLRTKFKHCVSDCKQAAMTIKTATGIERFQDEKGFGKWFDLLFPLVKSRDSCKPDMAVEPSAITGNDLSEEEEVAKTLEDFVPTKKVKLPKKNKVTEAVELLKQVVDKDPAKELIQFMQEEAEKARNHELKLVELMLKHTSNNTTSNHVNLSPALDKPTMQSLTFQSIPQGQGSWTAPQHYNLQGNENPVYPLSTMNSSERFFNPFKTSFQHFGSK